jgi:uncharacterized protein
MAVNKNNIIGAGLIFPLNIDSEGGVRPETGVSLIESSLRNIFSTPNNSRYFLGEFNCRLHELLDEPNDTITLNLLVTFIEEAISNWEPRITLINTKLSQGPTSITVELEYQVKSEQDTETFVFPFYNKLKH